MCLIAFYLLACFQLSVSLAPHEITILILSQKDAHNFQNAQKLKWDIIAQANQIKPPKVYLSHETFNSAGSWAITPILAENFQKILTTDTKWLILCEDQSTLDLKALIENLKQENFTSEIFLGYPLRDKEATIIHHFAFFENPSWFLYPLFKAGVAISIPLLKKLSQRLNKEQFSTEFFIDASHELSLFAWNNGKGHKLTVAPYFCLERKAGCAIYSKPYSTCNITVSTDEIFFAIKTCSKFHKDRVPIVQKTWGRYTKHIRFYSDHEDITIPTISTNVQNTETGHCEKVLSIFNLIVDEINFNRKLSGIKWIVLADDDTLMSVAELSHSLGCYNPNDQIYLGERYGYRLLSSDGFNYITGGGGIIFSVNVIYMLVQNCTCPSNSSPDDMIIAVCLQRLGIESIHSSRFHQARPVDYPPEILHNNPISFHKFWQIDPFEVYEKWFRIANEKLFIVPTDNNQKSNKNMCRNGHSDVNDIKKENGLIKITSSIQHIDL